MIPVYRPYFPEGSLDRAHIALSSGWVSSRGPYVEEAEERVRELLGRKHVVLTSSGSAAMKLAAHALYWKYPKTENIFAPSNAFVAAYNAFIHADSTRSSFTFMPTDPHTWNVKHGDGFFPGHSSALLVVHNLGNIVDVEKLRGQFMLSYKSPEFPVIEDNCEGLFGLCNGRKSGTASFCSAVSFYGNKTITSGEGGAFATDDDSVGDFARSFAGQGHRGDFLHSFGDNYRMTNVAAAILLGQIDHLSEILERKKAIFNRYRESLADVGDPQAWEPGTEHSRWMFGLRLHHTNFPKMREHLKTQGIESRPMFAEVGEHGYFVDAPKPCDEVAAFLRHKVIILPSYPTLTAEEQGRVIDAVRAQGR